MTKIIVVIIILLVSIITLSSYKSNKNNFNHEPEEVTIDNSQLETVINKIKEATVQPSISLKAERKPTTVFNSKLGGMPYLPPDFKYPYNKSESSDKRPLKLLAQINFEEMPTIPNYPEIGILQFYIAYEEKDNVQGINFEDLTEQTSFRVVYHENIIKDTSLLQKPPELVEMEDYYFPFTGEFLLTGIKENCYITPSDYRFNDLFISELKNLTDIEIKSSWDLSEEDYKKVYEELSSEGHKIGGYPFFTQEDPRDYKSNHDFLLLQIDSQFNNNYEIIWGDSGVANFFIKLEDLKNLDFTDVMYTWDCY